MSFAQLEEAARDNMQDVLDKEKNKKGNAGKNNQNASSRDDEMHLHLSEIRQMQE